MTRGRSDDLPAGSQPVCTRCGRAVSDDAVWCEGCGLNLKQQEELPSADAYSARVREERWLEEQTTKEKEEQQAKSDRLEHERAEKDTERKRELEKRQAQRDQRRAARRYRLRRHKNALIGSGIAGALLVGALVAWQVSRADVPVVGKSPLLASGGAHVSTAPQHASLGPQHCGTVPGISPGVDAVNVVAQGTDCGDAAYVASESYGPNAGSSGAVAGFQCQFATTSVHCHRGSATINFGVTDTASSVPSATPSQSTQCGPLSPNSPTSVTAMGVTCGEAFLVGREAFKLNNGLQGTWSTGSYGCSRSDMYTVSCTDSNGDVVELDLP